jgi:hypothetical protein
MGVPLTNMQKVRCLGIVKLQTVHRIDSQN